MPEEKEKETSTAVTMEKVNEAIEAALRPIKDALTGDNGNPGNDEEKERDTRRANARERARSRRTIRDIEAQAEELVQSEVAKVFTEKEHEAEHKKLEAERNKKEPENPPLKKRWLTELMCGKGYHEGTMQK